MHIWNQKRGKGSFKHSKLCQLSTTSHQWNVILDIYLARWSRYNDNPMIYIIDISTRYNESTQGKDKYN